MTTPNNAAALERLEKKWRDEAKEPRFPDENDRDAVEAYDRALIRCADELATLRAALTSQPSGEAVAWRKIYPNGNIGDWRLMPVPPVVLEDSAARKWHAIEYATHPSADAGVAVDEVLRGVCMRMLTFENSEYVPNVMFQQLRAALAPKPEGGHG